LPYIQQEALEDRENKRNKEFNDYTQIKDVSSSLEYAYLLVLADPILNQSNIAGLSQSQFFIYFT